MENIPLEEPEDPGPTGLQDPGPAAQGRPAATQRAIKTSKRNRRNLIVDMRHLAKETAAST